MKAGRFRTYLTWLRGRYQTLSLRERGLVMLSVLALIGFGWAGTVGSHLGTYRDTLRTSVDNLDQRVQAEVAEQSRLQSAKAEDPNARLRVERERLGAKLSAMEESLGLLLDRFVDPEHMPAVLEDVIRHHRGLTLMRIESLPAEPVEVSGPVTEGAEGVAVWIYRHPLLLELEGSYFDVLGYLAELEASPWEFGWRRLDYQVGKYPIARVTLEIETLSRERSWIGV